MRRQWRIKIRVIAPNMKILFWNQLYLPAIGGVEVLTARLAVRLKALGHKVTVVAGRYPLSLPETQTIDGIPIHRFPFIQALKPNTADSLASFSMLAEIITAISALKKGFKPDIIHINVSDPSPYFHLRSSKSWNCPMVLSFQAAVEPRLLTRNGVLNSLLKCARAIIVPSKAAAKNVAQHTNIPLERLTPIAPGVPAEDFSASPTLAADAIPTFVFLGRIVDYKGVDTAIEAIALLNGKARLAVIGDGPHREQLEQNVKDRALTHLIRFEGLVDDTQRKDTLMQSLAIVVPSCHEELFGMVAVEGSLSGLPVIASNIGGLAEIVIDGKTGFLVSPGSPAEIAAAMEQLMNDRELANRMGRAARLRALSEYTIERTVERYLTLYEECLS